MFLHLLPSHSHFIAFVLNSTVLLCFSESVKADELNYRSVFFTPRLTGVCPPVGFEVGALGVNLTAALKFTAMDASPLGVRRFGSPRPSHALDAER